MDTIFDLSNKQKHYTMNKLQEFTIALESKGIKFVYDTNKFDQVIIGYNLGGSVWNWFKFVDCGDHGNWMSFEQSYSQNTGKTFKGVRHGFKVTDAIEKRLKIKLFEIA